MKNQKGITLIALVITIIVLLILAVVSIGAIIGEDGITNRAQSSKETHGIAEEKEAIIMAKNVAIIDDEISKENLDLELNKRPGVGKYISQETIDEEGNKVIAITFTDSNRTYYVHSNGTVREQGSSGPNKPNPPTTVTREDFFVIDNTTGAISIAQDTSENHTGIGYYYNDAGEKILSEEHIVIPEKINGVTVTEIKESAFSNAINLKSITIPNTVKNIEFEAFYNCTNLMEITIPNSVTYVGYQAFAKCTNLKKAILSNKTTELIDTFRDCTNLSYVSIPNGVISLSNTFQGCSSLNNIELPDSITSLHGAFGSCTNLSKITIPDTVTNLDYTFANCINLKNITLPNSITSLQGTFSGCSKLEKITLTNNIKNIYNIAFENCISLTSIVIPKNIINIKDNAFSGCTNLTSITIEEGSTLTVPSNKWGASNATIY